MWKKLLLAVTLTLLGVFALSACSSSASLPADAVVVDVRTPAEYSQSHVDGALNIDLESGSFAQQTASLDKSKTYALYCRSGNRSAQAAQIMQQQGFTVIDMGGLDKLSKYGLTAS